MRGWLISEGSNIMILQEPPPLVPNLFPLSCQLNFSSAETTRSNYSEFLAPLKMPYMIEQAIFNFPFATARADCIYSQILSLTAIVDLLIKKKKKTVLVDLLVLTASRAPCSKNDMVTAPVFHWTNKIRPNIFGSLCVTPLNTRH